MLRIIKEAFSCLPRWIVTVFVLGVASASLCRAAEKPRSPLRQGIRPENFYRLVSGADPTICRPILDSLNRGHVVSDNTVHNFNIVGELLLSSELEVRWQRRAVGPDVFPSSLDIASVDIASDGHLKTVYRWDFNSGGIYANELSLSAAPLALPAEDPLPAKIITETAGPHGENLISIDERTAPALWRQVARLPSFDTSFDLNIVTVRKTVLLLVAGAIEAQYAVERGQAVHVYVVKYRSKTDLSLRCVLRSRRP
ncbi:MAG TPA: hypothetical protein VMF12_02730 [Xanthobacteraceae bacterium]|nr:hypothetical protein [Xanthobacteraceae bacterium]